MKKIVCGAAVVSLVAGMSLVSMPAGAATASATRTVTVKAVGYWDKGVNAPVGSCTLRATFTVNDSTGTVVLAKYRLTSKAKLAKGAGKDRTTFGYVLSDGRGELSPRIADGSVPIRGSVSGTPNATMLSSGLHADVAQLDGLDGIFFCTASVKVPATR